MAFDLSTARPIEEKTGFDISTARPFEVETEESKLLPSITENPISYLSETISNIPSSTIETGKSFVTPILHPIETGKAIGKTIIGTGQKLVPGRQEYEAYPEAIVKSMVDRYGGIKNIKETFKNDPIGVLADIATLSSFGGKQIAKAGKFVDPLTAGTKIVEKTAGFAGKRLADIGGLTTGAGESVSVAFKAGEKGGKVEKALTDLMRKKVSPEVIVQDSVEALDRIKQNRRSDYVKRLDTIKGIDKKIDIEPIRDSLSSLLVEYNIKKVKGKYDFSRARLDNTGINDVKGIIKKVDDWGRKKGDNTAYGLDTLKQQIDDFYSPSGEARALVSKLRNKVKEQIVKEVPEYGELTKNYETASKKIKNIQAELSLKQGTPTATTLRKLQQSLRQNFELRKEFVEELDKVGQKYITEKIAGTQLAPFEPRGLMRMGSVLTGSGFIGATRPELLPSLITTSPRVVGETALAAGKVKRKISPITKQLEKPFVRSSLFQAGRLKNSIPLPSLEE